MTGSPLYDVVVPTVGRASLTVLLAALHAQEDPRRGLVVVVDDRPSSVALAQRLPGLDDAPADVVVVRSGGTGPAGARNLGWRLGRAPWVAFVDDDVELPPDWARRLVRDLEGARPSQAASQGRLSVPGTGRRATDWERSVGALEGAVYATADCAYRRAVLCEVGGFDQRFPRAYREDADLALRVLRRGYTIERGTRSVCHPVRPAPWWISVAKQRGNADDAMMRRTHGRRWRIDASAPPGRFPLHVATVAAAVIAAWAAARAERTRARLAAIVWLGSTAQFAWSRIRRGPRSPREVAAMIATSIAVPFAACAWRVGGKLRARRRPTPRLVGRTDLLPDVVAALLCDRDGTLVTDIPYNGSPERIDVVPGVAGALDSLRAAGVKVGVVTNQSGIARGLLSHEQVAAVHRRLHDLLGPFAGVWFCPHGPSDGCACRKPAPGLVHRALAALGLRAEETVLVGDIGADVEAARRAGVTPVLVPTQVTRSAEIEAAPLVVATFADAAALVAARAPERRVRVEGQTA